MASTEELVPVRRRRCPACCSCASCSCSCGSFWWTRWLRKRLERPLGAHSVVDFFLAIFVAVSVAVFAILSVLDAMTNCDVRSETLPIIFTALICVGIPCVAAVGFVIQRDPFMRDDVAGGGGTEGLELCLLFAPIGLLAVGCVTLDAVFFLLVGACIHRDEGTFPTLALYRSGTVFHVVRMVFVVAQVAMFGWCFKTRSFARQKVYTVLLFTAVVMADLASWFYEIVDKPSVLCSSENACWDATVTKSYTCKQASNIFTEEYCTFVQFQLYCQPLVGTFALLSLPTMYYMWAKAREGEGGGATDSGPEQMQTNRPGAGGFMRLFLVTVAALSVGLFAVTHQATTVSAPADYYKVILYYSYKVMYFSLFILSTLAGCMSVQARGPREYRPRSADVLLLVIGALGVLGLNVRSLHGWTTDLSSPFQPEGCPHGITDGDFPKLRALLMADTVLNLAQLVLQTTFILSSVIHRRLEGRVGAHCAILCLFNISVWINGSFVEVQSTPLTTCYTTPVQRAAFGSGSAGWNVFLHLLQPVCMFYWLWSGLLMLRLLLRGVNLGQGRGQSRGVTVVQVGQTASIGIPMNSLRDTSRGPSRGPSRGSADEGH